MKKVFMAALALTMAVFVSCSKDDLNVENNDVKVNFTVAEKPNFDAVTRSVKKGWDNGDQILVVFNDAVGSWLDAFDDANTLRLTKTADGWTADKSKIDIADLSASADYKAIYYPGEVSFAESDVNYMLYFDTYKGGEYLVAEGTYTVNGSNIELGTINMIRDENMYQISVKGLASESGEWALTIQNSSGGVFFDNHLAGGKLKVPTTTYGPNAENVYANAGGVKYGEDVQFCFIKNIGNNNAAKQFELSNGTNTYVYTLASSTVFIGGTAYLLPALSEWEKQAE